MSIGKVVNADPDSGIPKSGSENAVVLGPGAQDQHLGGGLVEQPDEVVAGEAGGAGGGGRDDDASEADEEVLDHPDSSLPPRWATIRTSTPLGVAFIKRWGSGSRRRPRPRRGSDSPTIR